jgi:hypothetical protein
LSLASQAFIFRTVQITKKVLKIMTRLAVTAATTPLSIWGGFTSTVRNLGTYFAARSGTMSGIEALEQEHARIRLTSRHWLMG